MASNIGDIVATASLDISPFRSNMGQLKTYLRGVDSSLKAMETNFKGAGKNVTNLKALLGQTSSALKGYQEALKIRTQRYNDLKANIGDLSSATAEQKKSLLDAQSAVMSTAGKVAELTNRYKELAKAIRQTYIDESPFTKFGNAAIEMGNKWQKVGKSVSGFGDALTKGVTLPIVAGAGYAIKAAVDYETAFAGVKKTVNGTDKEFAQLSTGIRQMAKEMPASAVEIANVAEAAGQLGIPIGSIKGFTKTMIDLGVSTNLSSEEAATSIAKIGNIMQVQGKDLDSWSAKFGATVVGLGNNFATTERDIVSMANRLAASGKIAGLTTPEILGLATSMSSVGIEAEAGGTAMSQTLTNISKAVSDGGKELKIYADTAGMSADQFAEKWRTKPAEALQEFIKGLGRAKSEGKDTNQILDELGLTGIRQSNMLKSLGLAAETMGDAMSTANREWEKGTALSDEAGKRYETTASQLQIFKNKLTDVAIEIGGPLLKALNSGLDAAEPWIQKLAELAEKFSSLSTEQQQNIIKWGLMAAGAGPFFKILGGGISTIGGVMKAIGGLSKGIGILHAGFRLFSDAGGGLAGLKAAVGAIGGVETAAAGAASSTGLLSGAVALLGSPVTWGVLLGGAALVGIGMYAQSVQDAKKRTEEWGTEVSKNQAAKLETFKGKVDEAKQAMVDFGAGAGDVDKVTSSVQKLADEIGKLADKNAKKKVDIAKSLGLSDETIATIQKNAENVKANVQQMSNEIGSIYRNASEQHRQLTAEEQAIVTSNMNEMINTQLSLMKFSGEERVKITQAINGELDGLNQTQLKKAKETLEGWIKEENKSYEERKSNYKKLLADLKGTDAETVAARQELQQKLEELELEHNAKMEEYGKRWAAIEKKLTEDALKNSNPQAREAILKQLRKSAEELGFSYDEMVEKATNATSKLQEQSTMWAQTTKDASEAQRTANTQWNAMVWDLKEGKLKTNAVEEVQKALQAEGGWDSMQFILKEANLTSNARLTIGEALVANGQWESLSPSEKALVINDKPAIKAILDSKEMLASWSSLPTEAKELLGRNENFMNSAKLAEETLTRWNQLMPEQKEIIARDLASPNVQVAQGAIDSLMGKSVDINAEDKTGPSIASSTYAINSVLQNKPADINAQDNTAGPVADAQNNVNSPKQNQPISIEASDDTGDDANSANNSVNSPKQNQPISIEASDDTGDDAASADKSVNSPKQDRPIDIKAVDNATIVATGVISSLSQIPTVVTTFIDTVRRFFTEHHANGTEFHRGGLAVVNDQPGTLYKELITLPDGTSFIPQGRNVMLDLPRGSKVLKAGKTRNLMNSLGISKYADGIGFEDTKIAHLTRRIKDVNEHSAQYDDRRLVQLVSELVRLNGNKKADTTQAGDVSYTLNLNSSGREDFFTPENMKRLMRELAYYTNGEGGRLA